MMQLNAWEAGGRIGLSLNWQCCGGNGRDVNSLNY